MIRVIYTCIDVQASHQRYAAEPKLRRIDPFASTADQMYRLPADRMHNSLDYSMTNSKIRQLRDTSERKIVDCEVHTFVQLSDSLLSCQSLFWWIRGCDLPPDLDGLMHFVQATEAHDGRYVLEQGVVTR